MATVNDMEAGLARRLLVDHPAEAARLLDPLLPQDVVGALAELDGDQAARVLRHMERSLAGACLAAWDSEQRPSLLAALEPDVASGLLRTLDTARREEILGDCSSRVAEPIRRQWRFPEQTAGALMDSNPPAAPEDLTVEEARELLRRWSSRTRGQLYVVTREGVLVGQVETEGLLAAPDDTTLGSRMSPAIARLSARAHVGVIASHPGWRRHHTLPVVDQREVLVGALDHRTLHQLERVVVDTAEPLGLALGEMYWTMMSSLVDGLVRSVTPAVHRSDREVER